jgi:hypothetical protein
MYFLEALFSFVPKGSLLLWMTISVLADFATGILKSAVLGVARTSTGFRKTLIKFCQYGGAIAISFVIGNTAKGQGFVDHPGFLNMMNEGLLIFIIYIEITSICENIIAIDPATPFSKFFIGPLHKALTFQLKNNPFKKLSEETKDDNE